MPSSAHPYRGRLAPSPTGYLHLGHARTFWFASERARNAGGTLILRIDDLDRARCRPEFESAALEDLRWLGFHWHEGPDTGGPHAPYRESERTSAYRAALQTLHEGGWIFPCSRSRRDVAEAAGAPHEGARAHEQDEPLYPVAFRPPLDAPLPPLGSQIHINWRFRVPEREKLTFRDALMGDQCATAGVDFGDFLVWRKDDTPAYQLACVVDDAEMQVTEVVRGADLVTSTFRQLLLYRALGRTAPAFCHCPLVTDEEGVRLAKRNDALSLRTLRAKGVRAEKLLEQFAREAAT